MEDGVYSIVSDGDMSRYFPPAVAELSKFIFKGHIVQIVIQNAIDWLVSEQAGT